VSQAHADRNLLFGILAVQMDFVSQAQLIAAMHAWVLDKGKPLGQILHDQQALAGEHRLLLEAMVAAHVRRHAGDPQQSLAAVSSAASIRAELEQIADPDVHASLRHVPAARGESSCPAALDPHATAAYRPTAAEQRYRILRPHARGGLGEVFVAENGELHRQVALKQMRDRHAHDGASRGRFLLEAEVTGGLEHPGIVPVYGLGAYADGRPFYAMRFIRGDNLKEAIEQFHGRSRLPGGTSPGPARQAGPTYDSLEFRGLVGRFIDVCNAVAYAHSRGVLHRDLKPGNVMLGKFGETLVVDWGLAKASGKWSVKGGEPGQSANGDESPLTPASGSGVAETLAGSAVGTPAYMSPEQAAGEIDRLGPATDVYSLGATLYCLLTGRPPLSGDVAEMLRRAQAGDFPPPRQVAPQVALALEAVCLKAMALRPADRYATPLGLAEDLEHWLADEPVGAAAEPLAVRARRWMRKHPAAVSGAAAVVLVAAVGLAVGRCCWARRTGSCPTSTSR
jgi:serine/threonine-protein kinase